MSDKIPGWSGGPIKPAKLRVPHLVAIVGTIAVFTATVCIFIIRH